MAKFDADILRDLRDLREVSIRTEKHLDSAVVIWVVVADDEVFVRSVRGSKGRWYRDLATGGSATLEFAGQRLAVQADPVSDDNSIARASREYLRKYETIPTPSRWFAPRCWRPRCGWNRADQRQCDGERGGLDACLTPSDPPRDGVQ